MMREGDEGEEEEVDRRRTGDGPVSLHRTGPCSTSLLFVGLFLALQNDSLNGIETSVPSPPPPSPSPPSSPSLPLASRPSLETSEPGSWAELPNVRRNKKEEGAKCVRWEQIKSGVGGRREDERRWRGRADECQLSAPG